MVIFHSYVSLPEGKNPRCWWLSYPPCFPSLRFKVRFFLRARWHASTSSAMSWYFQNFCSKTSRSLAARRTKWRCEKDKKTTGNKHNYRSWHLYDIVMIYLWNSYEISMIYIYCIWYYMKYLWYMYGVFVIYLRYIYDIFMINNSKQQKQWQW